MVKVIIFDFWGTLVENGVWSPIKQVRNILGIRMPFSQYVVRMEKAMMTQQFATLKEAFEAICAEFGVECTQDKLDRLIGMWNKSWMLARPYSETETVLEKLSQDYKIILVSNTDSFSVNNVLNKFALNKYFSEKFLSFETKKIKTDPQFLQEVLEKLNVSPEDCVLIGDSVQSDMLAAKNVGIKAVLVDRRNSRDFHPKIKTLEELEKVLSI